MPIQVPQWNEFLTCPICFGEYNLSPRCPINLGCGHTLCKVCFIHLKPKQCPFDHTTVTVDPRNLVVNTALLQLSGVPAPEKPYHPPIIQSLAESQQNLYDTAVKCIEELAKYLKYNASVGKLSKPMQRKLVNLVQCTILDDEGRGRTYRTVRSLAERVVNEIILQHQNPQQLGANLWAAVRARGCQFLGPAMQEDVLKLVLLALEDGSPLSRKVLVMFVVQRLETRFPQASKTSIGHVVQLLYRASCFKVSKRDGDSSLMQLKEEFRTYENLRREHDSQIVQIATEAGLRIPPDQWSSLLYGDPSHKSHMQSIIDKLQTPQSFIQSVQELMISFQRSGDPSRALSLSPCLQILTAIDPNVDTPPPSWKDLADALCSVRIVVNDFVESMHNQNCLNKDTNQNPHSVSTTSRSPNLAQMAATPSTTNQVNDTSIPKNYKIIMCNQITLGKICKRGTGCLFAHNEEELELYRAKHRRRIFSQSQPVFQNYKVLNNNNNNNNNNNKNSAGYQNNYQHFSSQQTMVNGNISVQIPNLPPVSKEVYEGQRFPSPGLLQTVESRSIAPVNNYHLTIINSPSASVNNSRQQAPLVSPIMSQTSLVPKPLPTSQTSKAPISVPNSLSGAASHTPNLPKNDKKPLIEKRNGLVSDKSMMCDDVQTILGGMLRPDFLQRFSSMNSNTYQPTVTNNGPVLVSASQRDTFVRSDSILTDDKDCVPFEAQPINTFGPISRCDPFRGINNADSDVPAQWYAAQNVPKQMPIYNVQLSNTASSSNNTYNLSSVYNSVSQGTRFVPTIHCMDTSVRQVDKRRLVKGTHNFDQNINKSNKQLPHEELKRLEQDLQKQQVSSTLDPSRFSYTRPITDKSNENIVKDDDHMLVEEDTYEVGIANDIKELELKWESELAEVEKKWSKEDGSSEKIGEC